MSWGQSPSGSCRSASSGYGRFGARRARSTCSTRGWSSCWPGSSSSALRPGRDLRLPDGNSRVVRDAEHDREGPAGRRRRPRAVVYLAVFPMALFLGAVYSESLLLALVLAAFLCAERDHWIYAWVFTGARPARCSAALIPRDPARVALTRPPQSADRPPDRPRALRDLPAVLWRQTGDALGFVHAEKIWSRSPATFGPLSGLWQGFHAGIVGLGRVLTQQPVQGRRYAQGSDYTLLTSAFNVEALAFLILFIALTVVAWRRFGAVVRPSFSAVSIAIPLSSPNVGGWPLLSLDRASAVADLPDLPRRSPTWARSRSATPRSSRSAPPGSGSSPVQLAPHGCRRGHSRPWRKCQNPG